MNKGSIAVMVILICVALSGYWFNCNGSIRTSQTLLEGIYSQSPDAVQQTTQFVLQKKVDTWVPPVSDYLRRKYGTVKEIRQGSRRLVMTSGPLGEVECVVWKIRAERGNFEMETSAPTRNQPPREESLDEAEPVGIMAGKVFRIAFRFPPSSKWVAVQEWKNELTERHHGN